MNLHVNRKDHLEDFVRLNERWINQYFSLEERDRALASNPGKIIEDGGYIFTTVVDDRVVGACALFKDTDDCYQLARMAVDPAHQGKGYGRILMNAALEKAVALGARKVYLFSNTVLGSAVALYKSVGFEVVRSGQHPAYTRCNIVMEKTFPL